MTREGAPALPNGLVVFLKRECATCRMVAPLLPAIAAAGTGPLTVITQDDPDFPEFTDFPDDTGTPDLPAGPKARHDHDLSLSWHHDIETVPTLMVVRDGVEVERTVGWVRDDWQRFTGLADLGAELPVMRPGCGSMSVDPDVADRLEATFGGRTLHSRHLELAEAEDEFEAMFNLGFTDGLPVVPPTPERVLRMLTGTTRDPHDVVAVVPPDLVDVTVEKVAVNAVMAGCLPEYLPWVIAAVEAACTDEFNMHGVLATTMPVGPVVICNGSGTRAIGMNGAGNALGQGNRANLTIGRALQLVVRNVGGGRPGEVDRATHGNPGKVSFCFPELEQGSPFTSLSVSRGFAPTDNTVTLFAGEGPRCIVDQRARTAPELANTFAACLRTLHNPKLVVAFDALLVVGPEHARVFAEAGWDRDRVLAELHARLQLPGSELVHGAGGIADGVAEHFAGATLPKFRPDGILLVHAGGGAGLFSAIIGGWANGATGSQPVTRKVAP